MPRGTPDGNASPYTYAAQITDPGLIYQMLWGFSPIDSQGRVAYLDTFNNGLSGFMYEINGAAVAPIVVSPGISGSQQLVYSPPSAVKLSPGVATGDNTILERGFFWGTNTRLGLEVALRCHINSPNYKIRIDYRIDANHQFRAELAYDRSFNNWRIFTTGATYSSIFPMTMSSLGNLMLQIKIVADWSTGKYVRALIGEKLIDLSTRDMGAVALSIDNYLFISVEATSYGAGSSDGYIGYVLLTKDEP